MLTVGGMTFACIGELTIGMALAGGALGVTVCGLRGDMKGVSDTKRDEAMSRPLLFLISLNYARSRSTVTESTNAQSAKIPPSMTFWYSDTG